MAINLKSQYIKDLEMLYSQLKCMEIYDDTTYYKSLKNLTKKITKEIKVLNKKIEEDYHINNFIKMNNDRYIIKPGEIFNINKV